MIIATAGHVDHGKTTLLRALTGVDTTHLPEEKRRGMTIDLGYAYLPLEEGRVLGFIDVPGHEKFLANMLAGVGGVKQALLVVACDDGVMAQTQEHLTILRLLNIRSLTVALTKADKVDAQRQREVRQQVMQLLHNSGLPEAALFVTSAVQNKGITELREHLITLMHEETDDIHRFRLAIDRVFTIKGSGLVVTGTALSGNVQVGDTLWLTGSDSLVRIRGIHSQNQPSQQAGADQRVALNLAGDVSKSQIERGDWLLSKQPPSPFYRVLIELMPEGLIQHWQPVHVYHAASHVTGRISLLQSDIPVVVHQPLLAELVLDKPLYLVEEDRLLLRNINATHTLAGARVIVLQPPRRGKRQPDYLAWLAQRVALQDEQAILAHCLQRGQVSGSDFAWARQLSEEGMSALIRHPSLLMIGGNILTQSQRSACLHHLLLVLEQEHHAHPDQLGVGRARLKRMAFPATPDEVIFTFIDQLIAEGSVCNTRGWLHLPQHNIAFTLEQQLLWQSITDKLQDQAWWIRDIATEMALEEKQVRTLFYQAAQLGYVTAIVRDRYFTTAQMYRFAQMIRATCEEQGHVGAADFRDRLGIGRKLAIQILEYFDRSGFTRRKGNLHLLRDNRLFTDII